MGPPEETAIAKAANAINGAATISPTTATRASSERGIPFLIGRSSALLFPAITSAGITGADSFDGANDVDDFVVAHTRKDRQTYQPFPKRCGYRTILRPIAECLLVVGMQM